MKTKTIIFLILGSILLECTGALRCIPQSALDTIMDTLTLVDSNYIDTKVTCDECKSEKDQEAKINKFRKAAKSFAQLSDKVTKARNLLIEYTPEFRMYCMATDESKKQSCDEDLLEDILSNIELGMVHARKALNQAGEAEEGAKCAELLASAQRCIFQVECFLKMVSKLIYSCIDAFYKEREEALKEQSSSVTPDGSGGLTVIIKDPAEIAALLEGLDLGNSTEGVRNEGF